MPSTRYGEEVAAHIKLKPGQSATVEEIKEFSQGKITRHKIPKYIKFVEEYPVTASGKIQKFLLRDQAVEEFNLHDERPSMNA